MLGPRDFGGSLRLAIADLHEFVGTQLEVAAVPARRVAHDDVVALAREPRERAAREDLEVVRMGADAEDAHRAMLLGAFAESVKRAPLHRCPGSRGLSTPLGTLEGG